MRPRPVPPIDELQALLAEAGVEDAPGDHGGDPERLRGLLDLALHVAECDKRVAFPAFTWADPRFVARDSKVDVTLAHMTYAGGVEALRDALLAELPRVRDGVALLALDARASSLKEFELNHALYGEVTLFAFRHRPSESADPRLDAARERGWTKTLKEHNLLPGRGLVVLDEHQGLLLREAAFEELLGLLVLLPSGQISLLWNPVARRGNAELQYWLSWGKGIGASEWREVLRYEGEDE